MKVALDIKNVHSITKPKEDDIIIYDGKVWCVTTKEKLFKEYQDKVDAKLEEITKLCAELKENNNTFKKEVATQLSTMSELIKTLYSK